ncbi:hypothetical protein WMF37_05540 [Sorangium sp. So ce291]|uniref:hypothetical protein n=1 Tax=Sorangium sp. So ce291 TaxID=3133294 RepID=UPI003F5FEFE0
MTRLAGKSLDEIVADGGVRVVSSTQVLASDNVDADIEITRGERPLTPQRAPSPEVEIDLAPYDFRFEVRSQLVERDAVHLRVVLELDGRPTHLPHTFSGSAVARNRQFVPFRTGFPARGERLVVLLVRPEILRDQEDWQRSLERRRFRLRDAGPAAPSGHGHGRPQPRSG